jgi:hypothetical protein
MTSKQKTQPKGSGGTPSAVAASAIGKSIPESSKMLQERLHELLSRISATLDAIKNWPSADGASVAEVHAERTTKLIASVQSLLKSISKLEEFIAHDQGDLRATLQQISIPLDLLDLLDHGGFMHPDCFVRGLLQEALGQLAGLKRRKLALEMLGTAVQSGISKRKIAWLQQQEQLALAAISVAPTRTSDAADVAATNELPPLSSKRGRDESDGASGNKKPRTSASE